MSYKSIHTGQQIDAGVAAALNPDTTPTAGSDALMTSGGTKSALDTFVRPNLLDNAYFVGGGSQQGGEQFPINQRGQTSYSSDGYTIDRWKAERYRTGTKTITLYADSLTLANSDQTSNAYIGINQTNEVRIPDGTLVTMTALVGNNLYSFSDTIVNSGYRSQRWDNFAMFFKNTSDGKLDVIVRLYYGSSVAIKAVKLELGSDQTLAHQENGVWVLNEIPDYDEQLYRCCASTADSSDTYANKPYNKQGVFNVPVWSGYTLTTYNSFITGNVQNTNCTITGFGIVAGMWALIAYVYSGYFPKTEVLAPGIMYEGNDALECLIRITAQGELFVFVSNQLATQFAGKSPIVVVNTSYLIA